MRTMLKDTFETNLGEIELSIKSECEIQYQNIRSGEYHDMNLCVKNWDETSSSMLTWENVYIHKAPKAKIKKEIIKPIRKFFCRILV